MLYSALCGCKVSRLGFGTMRLPTLSDGSIDDTKVQEMVDTAVTNGINYFDTAYPYHGGKSEITIGKALRKYPRDSYYLASKFPGHQIAETYYPEEIFEKQLMKCGVDYFDFYLLHNVYENSVEVYKDSKWGILDYFLKQKDLGRIKHLGFSSHARPECLKEFLDYCGDKMEFCQIQINYLDWTLQSAKEKYELLTERRIPIIAMEPIRGGRLQNLDEAQTQKLQNFRPESSNSSWALRWLINRENVSVVLSGMSDINQMKDNINTFTSNYPLNASEEQLLLELAEGMKNSVPCTQCRYCCDGCAMKLNIPLLIQLYNDVKFEAGMTQSMQLDTIETGKTPDVCIDCGACKKICPQGIDIPLIMKELASVKLTMPNWITICEERNRAAKQL